MNECTPRGNAASLQAVRRIAARGAAGKLASLIPRAAIAMLARGGRRAKTRHPVGVLFVDIEGCTRLCEDLPAREMNAVTERYFSAYLDEIRRAGGEVTEVLGDGLLALFEAGSLRDCVHASLAATAGIREKTLQLNSRRTRRHDEIRVNMGLNAGTTRIGFTRLSGRCGERWVYAATGPVVNVAARLLGLATGGQVLTTRAVADQLEAPLTWVSLGARTLKNVSSPVEVVAVDATSGARPPAPRRAQSR